MALTAQPPPESHMISIGLLETGQPHCQTRKLKSVPLFIVVKALPNGRLRVKQNTRTKFFFKFFIIKISLNTNVSLSLKFDYSKETRIKKKNHDTNAVCPSEKTHAQYFGVNFVKTTQGAITQLDSRG